MAVSKTRRESFFKPGWFAEAKRKDPGQAGLTDEQFLSERHKKTFIVPLTPLEFAIRCAEEVPV